MKAKHECFMPYDPANYLGGIEDVAASREVAIDEGGNDPAVITHALGVLARAATSASSRDAPA